MGCPAVVELPASNNLMVPVTGESVGLTSRNADIHPPPSTKWGKRTGSELGDVRFATGSVVIRNSPRSFVNPRSAITDTGTEELTVNAPVTEGPLLTVG